MILTGGPGTGKTTTVKGIIEVFKRADKNILLAAPTGRAAKRMNEATGMEARTIHRLLEAKPPSSYQRNEENKLESDVLIIDESSMIDIVLMYNLLKAVPDEMTVIFVGDADQLPSVGPGNVLRDMIGSGTISVVQLTRIFRQAMDSRIVMNAHRVNHGEFPDLSNKNNTDFFFVSQQDELVLAYSITVHKAQGSEYDIVVLPLTTQHYMMLQRNLLYTAITRAKKAVVIVGSERAVRIAIKSDQVVQRNTELAIRLGD